MAKTRRKVVHLSLDVTPEVKGVLEGLAARAGTSQAEILRRAIGLYMTVKNAQESGEGEPVIAKDDKVVVRLLGV